MKVERRTWRSTCGGGIGRFSFTLLLPAFFPFACVLFAGNLDLNKLPSSAPMQIDFARDIQQLLENACLRCHGPEKPKSRFRLDTREAALKGGENGVDIIPGDSAKSPLIHYVAGLVQDMEMPPPGKGDPLTSEQIGLLRAWIDQGVSWSATNKQAHVSFSVAPTFRYFIVSGDRNKFREVEGLQEGSSGGVENFFIREQIAEDTFVSAEGHALFNEEDYSVKLSLDQREKGFVRGGFEQWRQYFDDSGAYDRQAFLPSVISLDRDLHLDIGRAWLDFGLTLPDWPQMTLGYEYQWREGAKSTRQYGDVNGRNIYPAWKEIDEQTHILKFNLAYELYDWRIEDNARVEIFDSKTRRDNVGQSFGGVASRTTRIDEKSRHTQGANAFHFERQVGDWIFLAGGYLYSKLEGDAAYSQLTFDSAGILTGDQFWHSDAILLRQETHLFSLSSALTGVEGLTVSASIQNEWSWQEGMGRVHLDEYDPAIPSSTPTNLTTIDSSLDRNKFSENFVVRFAQIPQTVLFGDVRWSEEGIRQLEDRFGDPPHDFSRDTDAVNLRQEYRAGFNASPWRTVSFSAQYKKSLSNSDYGHLRDDSEGYPAFIRAREIDTDEVSSKLVVRPIPSLKTSLGYRIFATDYKTATDATTGAGASPGGGTLAGNTDGQVATVNATLTPLSRFSFSTTLSYTRTRTVTANHYTVLVRPYRGDVYTALASVNFALNKTTDLQALYSFSTADYSQNNRLTGLWTGIDYDRHGTGLGVVRRWNDYLATNLRYNFYYYREPNSGNANNYLAHGIYATLNLKWP